MHFVDLVDKPNSVLPTVRQAGTIIYLGRYLHNASSGTPVTLEVWSGTALHGGKDLFVAFPPRDGHIPLGNSRPFGVDVSVVTSILTDDGRYPLPFCQIGPCSDFPLAYKYASDCLTKSTSIIPHFNYVMECLNQRNTGVLL